MTSVCVTSKYQTITDSCACFDTKAILVNMIRMHEKDQSLEHVFSVRSHTNTLKTLTKIRGTHDIVRVSTSTWQDKVQYPKGQTSYIWCKNRRLNMGDCVCLVNQRSC